MVDKNNMDLSIYSCAANSTCECTLGASCDCSANNHPWLNMKTTVSQPTIAHQITYDNDRTDGNATSILGSPKGPYSWSYTAQISQTLDISAWHDSHQYDTLGNPKILQPVDLVEATVDLNPGGLLQTVNHVNIPLAKGETLYIALMVEYPYYFCCGILSKPTWVFFKMNSSPVPDVIDSISYVIPPQIGLLARYIRSFEVKFSPWEYQ
jgi:hypothetical protein